MFGLFKKLKAKPPTPKSVLAVFAAGGCPCCNTPENCLLVGPAGGMSVNIMCEHCGSRFNYTDLRSLGHPLPHVEWTHGPQKEIWGNRMQTKFPSDTRVAEVQHALESYNRCKTKQEEN